MFTTSFRDTCLNQLSGTYIGLIKTITDWRAGTVTEATFGNYARVSVTWNTPAAIGGSPSPGRERKNASAAVTFGQSNTANEDEIAFGVWSAATSGTLHCIGLLDAKPPLFGTVDTTDTATETITCPGHGLGTDHRMFVMSCPGAPIPAGLSENTIYWVRTGSATDTFTVATSQGGAAVNITASGAALFCPFAPVTVATNATPEFAINALVVQL